MQSDVWVNCAVVCASCWCMQSLQPTQMPYVDTALDILCILSVILMLAAFIDVIIGADDYYKIAKSNGKNIVDAKVYLYKRHRHTYKMSIIIKQEYDGYYATSKAKFLIGQYKVLEYAKEIFFLFTLAEDKSYWYGLIDDYSAGDELGKRIDETVFISHETEKGKKILSALHENRFVSYPTDECFTENVSIIGAIKREQKMADRYIILKNDGAYKVLGLFFKDKKALPNCFEETDLSFTFAPETKPQTIVSQDGNYTVK